MPNLATRPASSSKSSWLPRSRTKLLALAVSACFAANSNALPTDPVVANGNATFAKNGNVLNVTNSNGAIIDWKSFSIGASETTRFIQTAASSAVLNRVLANDPSLIYGTLTSNGKVWLINPAGIMVGAGGRVDTAGFVASTLNISNQNFLAGRNLFESTPGAGSVVNQGSITTPSGGSVYLIGPNVSNEGIITTPQGETILAAGQTVSLIDTATPGVKVDITGAEGNVTNLGSVIAEAGRIGMAGVLVKNSGVLNASSVVSEGGRIFLKATKSVTLDGTSVIRADAGQNGNGGNVLVWGDETASIDGAISARGGSQSGNGGFIETSAARVKVADSARVSTLASNGKTGTWLIDPNDFKIDSGANGGDMTGVAVGAAVTGNNFLIETATMGTPGGNGDIFVNEAVFWNNANKLTLNAERNIEFNASITATSGNLDLIALGSIVQISGAITLNRLDASAGTGIDLRGAGNQITVFNATNSNSGNIWFTNSIGFAVDTVSNSAAGGEVTLVASTGNIGIGVGGNIVTNGGLASVTADAGSITLGDITTTANVWGANGGDITVTGTSISLGNLTGNGASGSSSVNSGKGGNGATIMLQGTSITVGNITANGGQGSSRGAGGNGGQITIQGPGASGAGASMIHVGDIVANGGAGGSRGGSSASGGSGGKIYIKATAGSITVGSVTANGGKGGGTPSCGGCWFSDGSKGGDGGVIDLHALTTIQTGTLSANGGIGGDGAEGGNGGYGGNGGQIKLLSDTSTITITGNVNAYGGLGGSGGGHSDLFGSNGGNGGWGGSGGSVTLDAGSDITLKGSIFAYGGDGGAGGVGGNGGTSNRAGNGGTAGGGGGGGSVTMTAGGGIKITGNIDTYGGNSRPGAPAGSTGTGSGNAGLGNSGGAGGPVSLTANGIHPASGKAISVTGINTHGGHGYGAGSTSGSGGGGWGGQVTLVSNSASITGTAIEITSIDTRGGDANGNSSAGWGGPVSITTASGGVTVTSIDTRGGDAAGTGSGGRGRSVTVLATNGNIAIDQIDARGGNGGSGYDGGIGGAVVLTTVTTGNITVTNINTGGGNGGSDGNSGGPVTLMTDTGNITAIAIDTRGGNGGTSWGRPAGDVTLTTNVSGDISVGTINAYGGSGPGRGGDGGTVNINAKGGISVGTISTYGGGLLGSGSSGSGGRGGDVSLTAYGIHAGTGKAISVTSIDTHGGDDYNYDGIQDGGNVMLVSNSTGVGLTGTAIAITSINTRGGNDPGGSSAGNGGTVSITTNSGGVTVTSIDTRGGNAAGTGSGGGGGGVSISATNGSIAVGLIDTRGGSGGNYGGSGGSVSLATVITGDITATGVDASGGDGSYYGGGGGIVSLMTGAGNITATAIDTHGGNGAVYGYTGGDVWLTTAYGGSVSASAINVAGGIGSSNGTMGSINIDAYGNISFSQVGDLPSTANLSASSIAGDIAIAATGNISIDGGRFTAWGGGSTLISAGGNMAVGGISSAQNFPTWVVGSLGLTAGGQLNLTGNIDIDGSLALAASSVVASSPITVNASLNTAVFTGALDLSGGAMISANYNLGLLAGTVNLSSGGKLEAGNEIVIAAGSVKATGSGVTLPPGSNSHISAYGGMVTVGVASDITLDNGAYIEAGTDVRLTLNGTKVPLTLNSVPGQTPSYIWAHSPNTIYLAFPLLASGGVMIDGKETLDTLAGGSGLFVGADKTPAKPGFGLNITYQQQGSDFSVVTVDLLRAIADASPDAPTTQIGGLQDDARRLSGYTAGGKSDEFGDEEGKDDKDKNAGDGSDKPQRDKGKQSVATCS